MSNSSTSVTGVDGTDGEPMCPQLPSFTCTVPYDGSLGDCGGADFFDDCCMRPTCNGDEDCADGESCIGAGNNGIECHDQDVEGTTVCSCGANPGGPPRTVCLPDQAVPVEWCASNADEETCNSAPQIEVAAGNIQRCQWIDVHVLTINTGTDSCDVDGPEPRCLTIRLGNEDGCSQEPCGLGPDFIVLNGAQARFVDETHAEVFGVNDIFCGDGTPVGDWIRADDASLGPCALECGSDNPCALPFGDHVEQRATASKDSPVDDCGHVTLDDALTAWQDAQTCALEHAVGGQGFRVIGQGPGIDSIVENAFVGLQGESYAVVRLAGDSGGLGPYALYEEAGSGLVASEDCEVAVGELCLTVTPPGDVVQLCPS